MYSRLIPHPDRSIFESHLSGAAHALRCPMPNDPCLRRDVRALGQSLRSGSEPRSESGS